MSYVIRDRGPQDAFVRGDGCWLEDGTGRRFLDARAGMSNMMLGYGRRDIADAMYEQAIELPYAPALRHNRPAATTLAYAQALRSTVPASLTRVRLTHTGSAAMECALHMARRYFRNIGSPQKRWFISLEGSYHGSTLMGMAVSGQAELHSVFEPMPAGFAYVPPPAGCRQCSGADHSAPDCLDDLRDMIDQIGPENIAGVVIELVSNQRAIALPEHYVHELRRLCASLDILLIYDEVYTGFGRTGPMFATEFYADEPDIMCLSKGITAGYAPLAAVLASERVYAGFDGPGRAYFAHGSTSDGHAVSCAAGLAVLAAYEREDILVAGRAMGSHLLQTLRTRLSGAPWVGAIRGIGAGVAIEIVDADRQPVPLSIMRRIADACLTSNVLIDYTRHVLSIVPPLTLTAEEIHTVTTVITDVLSKLKEHHGVTTTSSPPSITGR